MPEPNQYENRTDFIKRCMSDDEANQDFPKNEQRLAFCNSVWTESKKAKTKKDYNFRNLNSGLTIKDVDTKSRIVAGYFSAFNNVDSDGDLIKEGAFTKSINERGVESNSNRKIAHLAFHDMRRPVGVLQVLKEDSNGLYFESKLGTHTDGEDALKMYDSGIIKEHSIGFQYIQDKTKWIDLDSEKSEVNATSEGLEFINKFKGYNEINEVKLWEGSFVTFGANSSTPSYGVIKSKTEQKKYLNEINERMSLIRKEIANGTYSEKGFQTLLQELAYIQEQYNSLLNVQPVLKSTENIKAEKDENLKLFLLSTIKK